MIQSGVGLQRSLYFRYGKSYGVGHVRTPSGYGTVMRWMMVVGMKCAFFDCRLQRGL